MNFQGSIVLLDENIINTNKLMKKILLEIIINMLQRRIVIISKIGKWINVFLGNN
jgi:hypothetical protein